MLANLIITVNGGSRDTPFLGTAHSFSTDGDLPWLLDVVLDDENRRYPTDISAPGWYCSVHRRLHWRDPQDLTAAGGPTARCQDRGCTTVISHRQKPAADRIRGLSHLFPKQESLYALVNTMRDQEPEPSVSSATATQMPLAGARYRFQVRKTPVTGALTESNRRPSPHHGSLHS